MWEMEKMKNINKETNLIVPRSSVFSRRQNIYIAINNKQFEVKQEFFRFREGMMFYYTLSRALINFNLNCK